MRPRVVVITFVLAVAVFGLAGLISQTFHQSPVPAASTAPPSNPTVAEVEPVPPLVAPSPRPSMAAAPPIANTTATVNPQPAGATETNPPEAAQDRVAELMALAMNDDRDSLNTIRTELTNPDAEIRAGALAAVVQFGDRSVSPRLRQLAAQTDDPHEKVSILDAADQLDLPPLGSVQSNPPPSLPQ